MRRIAIAAAKGGTGKTTTAVSLAHGLTLAGRRVVLVDCDIRRHAALHFGLASGPGVAALLDGGSAAAVEVRAGLRVVDSGGPALGEVEMRLADDAADNSRLRQALACVRDADYMLLDCPPSMGPMQRNALLACDEILLPVGADFMSLLGARQTLDAIRDLPAPGGTRPRLLGLLPTFYDAAAASVVEVEAALRNSFAGQVLQTRVHFSDGLRAAPALGGTVFESDPLSRGALDYALLTEEIEDLSA